MEYMVTAQLEGLLVQATCFNTVVSVIRDSPMEIRIIDHRGKVLGAVEGWIDVRGRFIVEE